MIYLLRLNPDYDDTNNTGALEHVNTKVVLSIKYLAA